MRSFSHTRFSYVHFTPIPLSRDVPSGSAAARSRSPACCRLAFVPQLTKPFASNGLPERAIDAYRTMRVTPPTIRRAASRECQEVQCHWEAESRRIHRTCSGGSRGGPKPHEDRRTRIPASDPEDHAAEGEDRRQRGPSSHRSSRCSRLRVSDCLRECRQSVSRPRLVPARRSGDPGGDRGRPMEAGAPVLRRKRAHRGGRRRPRVSWWRGGVWPPSFESCRTGSRGCRRRRSTAARSRSPQRRRSLLHSSSAWFRCGRSGRTMRAAC